MKYLKKLANMTEQEIEAEFPTVTDDKYYVFYVTPVTPGGYGNENGLLYFKNSITAI